MNIIIWLNQHQSVDNFDTIEELLNKAMNLHKSSQQIIEEHSDYISRHYKTSIDNNILPGHLSIVRASFDLLRNFKPYIEPTLTDLNSVIQAINSLEKAIEEATRISAALYRAKELDAEFGLLMNSVLGYTRLSLEDLLNTKERLNQLNALNPGVSINQGIELAIKHKSADDYDIRLAILEYCNYIERSEQLRKEFKWQMQLENMM